MSEKTERLFDLARLPIRSVLRMRTAQCSITLHSVTTTADRNAEGFVKQVFQAGLMAIALIWGISHASAQSAPDTAARAARDAAVGKGLINIFDNDELQGKIDLAKKLYVQMEALKNQAEGREKYDHDLAKAAEAAANKRFEAENEGMSEADKIQARRRAGMYGDHQ